MVLSNKQEVLGLNELSLLTWWKTFERIKASDCIISPLKSAHVLFSIFKHVKQWKSWSGFLFNEHLLKCLFFPGRRAAHSCHRKRFLRHDISQRGLPVEEERRERPAGPAANQHGDERHVSSNQGQRKETGPDFILTWTLSFVADLLLFLF